MPWDEMVPPRPMGELEGEHARHDRVRDRYGKLAEGAPSGVPCPAWCKGPSQPTMACDRCRGIASKPKTMSVWGKTAPVRREKSYREKVGKPIPAPESKESSDRRKAQEERERSEDLWRQLQEDLQ